MQWHPEVFPFDRRPINAETLLDAFDVLEEQVVGRALLGGFEEGFVNLVNIKTIVFVN